MTIGKLKKEVRNYWELNPCGTEHGGTYQKQIKFSKKYFGNIENHRYSAEPEIHPFAQFSQSRGKKILEVGVGIGTDFLQWIKSGAEAYGIDLSKNSINITKARLKTYGLEAKELKVADCEDIPYSDNLFDLVYSWGVIHHTPNPIEALDEIIRVTKPQGLCKVMVYHRHSLLVLFLWLKICLLKGRFNKSFSWVVANYMESPGTRAFTKREMLKILGERKVNNIKIETKTTSYDLLRGQGSFLQLIAKCLAKIFGYKNVGWFMTIQFSKANHI